MYAASAHPIRRPEFVGAPHSQQSHAASCTHPATVPAEEGTDGSRFGRSCATRCWLGVVQGAVLCLTALFVSSWALLRSYKQRELFHRHLEYPLTITLKSERQFSPFLHLGIWGNKRLEWRRVSPAIAALSVQHFCQSNWRVFRQESENGEQTVTNHVRARFFGQEAGCLLHFSLWIIHFQNRNILQQICIVLAALLILNAKITLLLFLLL